MTKHPNPFFGRGILKTILGFFGVLILISPTVLISNVNPASAAGDSTNFKVRSDQIGTTPTSQSSTNYQINGSIEQIVGSQSGNATQMQLGSPTNPGTASVPVVPPPGGGLGNNPDNCPDPGQLSLVGITCTRIYKGLFKLQGARSINTPYIFVNGELSGVYLSSPTTWEKDIWLSIGENTIVIYGENACEERTPPITIVLTRPYMGDINSDTETDDYDLSTFTRRWERRNDCPTDFNRDLLTDDYDLSLLASSWTG